MISFKEFHHLNDLLTWGEIKKTVHAVVKSEFVLFPYFHKSKSCIGETQFNNTTSG